MQRARRPGARDLPTRVLMLSDNLLPGGAERLLVGLATHLDPARYRVTVCLTRPLTPEQAALGELLATDLARADIPVVQLARNSRLSPRAFAQLVRLLREQRIEVLHAHKFGSNVWGTLLGRLARVPVVIAHEQTWSYEGQRLRRTLDGQLIGRLASAFVAVSSADRERMIALEGVAAEKIVLIPNAYVPRPHQNGGDLRAQLGIAPDAPLIGTAAIHRPQKALDVLLDAFARVAERVPGAELVIGGEGPRSDELRAHAARLPCARLIHFPGMLPDVGALLDTVDVAVMSSDFEGTPLFAFECMAHGTPLVATAVGGLPDVIEDGVSGLLVAPRDPVALADALLALLEDPTRRASLASAARPRLEDFTIERISERFAELYERLLDAAR